MVQKPDRISIIGAGTMGGTIAYTLLLNQPKGIKEILLVDQSESIVQGQALDLSQVNDDITVRAGTFKEAGQSALVILTVDVPLGDNHTHWLRKCRNVLLGIASSMSPVHEQIMILVLSHPNDLYVQSLQSYFPHVSPARIFGMGTCAATRRFHRWLKDMFVGTQLTAATSKADIKITDAYCIGSPDSPVVLWHHAKVNGTAVSKYPLLEAQRSLCDKAVSNYRHHLIAERKSRAWFSDAAEVGRLVLSLFSDTHTEWVLSVHVSQYDCCLSWPVVVGRQGIVRLLSIPLAATEQVQVSKVTTENIDNMLWSMEDE